MRHHLAQINIARFRQPMADPVNADFLAAIDRVNAVADRYPGFVWRLVGDGGDATDIRAFDDPNMLINMSLWTDIESLKNFVYGEAAHREIMHRRREWFDRIESHTALWWRPAGSPPTLTEAKATLDHLARHGAGPRAFTFAASFPPPGADGHKPLDRLGD